LGERKVGRKGNLEVRRPGPGWRIQELGRELGALALGSVFSTEEIVLFPAACGESNSGAAGGTCRHLLPLLAKLKA
jgi:hypothetical protein